MRGVKKPGQISLLLQSEVIPEKCSQPRRVLLVDSEWEIIKFNRMKESVSLPMI